MSKTLQLALTLALIVLFASSSAQAISLGFDPIAQTVQVGDTVNVNVSISGLGLPPFISGFNLDILFNASVLSLDSVNGVVFGTALGDPAFEASTAVSPGLGLVNIFEVSFLQESQATCTPWFPPDPYPCIGPYLDELQTSSSFVLATLNFIASDIGESTLQIVPKQPGGLTGGTRETDGTVCTQSQLNFETCTVESLSADLVGGRVSVLPTAAVPEPTAIFLLGSGLACLAVWRRRKHSS